MSLTNVAKKNFGIKHLKEKHKKSSKVSAQNPGIWINLK